MLRGWFATNSAKVRSAFPLSSPFENLLGRSTFNLTVRFSESQRNSVSFGSSQQAVRFFVLQRIPGNSMTTSSNDAIASFQQIEEDEKQHTFRKRRLSLPMHHLSAGAEQLLLQEGNNSEDEEKQIHAAAAAVDAAAASIAMAVAADVESDAVDGEEEKAHTFRKRRLSLTTASSASEAAIQDTGPKRPRRSSIDSVASSTTSEQRKGKFVSRTVHAGELINGHVPPPSPNFSSVLYQQTPSPLLQAPNSTSDNNDKSKKKKWQRRRTLHPVNELHKLPFSREIVGTYSCHGVEPVYGSEYDDDEEGAPESEQLTVPAIAAEGVEILEKNMAIGRTTEEQSAVASESLPQYQKEMALMVAKINQDRGGIAFPYGNCPKTALFAVYDGHGQGGEMVSQFALHEIQRRLEKHPKFGSDLETAFKETFMAVDNALRDESEIEPLFAGTTACVALLQDSKLTLANAGDSRAVVARPRHPSNDGHHKFLAIELTQDQNPDTPKEMERILNAGGYVSMPPAPGLSARVWLDPLCTQIGLAMARSIGDHAVSTVGVIAEPAVTTYEITDEDEFLLIASDGVWEFLESTEAVNIVGETLATMGGATKACQALIEAAAARWHEEEGAYRDDITAIVVCLKDLWKGANMSTRRDSINSEVD